MKKNQTHPLKTSSNLKNSKYLILILLKEGKNRKELEETLKLSKPTILGHIRDLKKLGLVKEGHIYNYPLTALGHEITHEEFNKLVYRVGGRVPLEMKVDKRKRFHNLFFTSNIIRKPLIMPSNSKERTFSKNNSYYTIQYKNGSVRIHSKKAVLQVLDFTSENTFEGSIEVQRVLRELINEIEVDNFQLDKIFKTFGYHIADMWHPLANFFKTRGSQVLVSDRLIIDFSHGTPELETINKNTAPEDMIKVSAFFEHCVLNTSAVNLENLGKIIRNLK